MPKRFTPKVYTTIYKMLAARDGDACLICGKTHPAVKLEIDHADGDIHNWDPENLHLLCKRDNLALRNKSTREHIAIIRAYSASIVCERERTKGCSGEIEVTEIVDYRNGSIEMQANSYFENLVIDFILTTIREQHQADRKDLINSAAQFARCSPITAKRYLEKLTSSIGPLSETRDGFGNVIIVLKPQKAPHGVTKPGVNGLASGKTQKTGSGDTVTISRALRGESV